MGKLKADILMLTNIFAGIGFLTIGIYIGGILSLLIATSYDIYRERKYDLRLTAKDIVLIVLRALVWPLMVLLEAIKR